MRESGRSFEEVLKEIPRYSQTVTDLQNETGNSSIEIAYNFLESQKRGYQLIAIRLSFYSKKDNKRPLLTTGLKMLSSIEIADICARTVGAMAEAY